MTRLTFPFLILIASCNSSQVRDAGTIKGNDKAIESIKEVTEYIKKSDINHADKAVIYSTLAEADRALVNSSLAIKDCNARESALVERVAKSDSNIWFWRKVSGGFFLVILSAVVIRIVLPRF